MNYPTHDIEPFNRHGHFTAMDNAVFDIVMPRISLPALAVLLFVLRETVGWNQEWEELPYSKIKAGTGIKSDATIAKSLAELCAETTWGTALLLRQEGAKIGAASHSPTRYALNKKFTIYGSENLREFEDFDASKSEVREPENEPPHGSKNEAHASKNEVFDTSKNEAPFPYRKKIEKQSSNYGLGGRRRAREETEPPPPVEIPHQNFVPEPQAKTSQSEEILAAVCEVCALSPDSLKPRDKREFAALESWILTLGLKNPAAEIRRRFNRTIWGKTSPPFLSFIRPDWAAQGYKADATEAAAQGENRVQPQYKSRAERLAEERRAALCEVWGVERVEDIPPDLGVGRSRLKVAG